MYIPVRFGADLTSAKIFLGMGECETIRVKNEKKKLDIYCLIKLLNAGQ